MFFKRHPQPLSAVNYLTDHFSENVDCQNQNLNKFKQVVFDYIHLHSKNIDSRSMNEGYSVLKIEVININLTNFVICKMVQVK